ncbi:MAG: hypothetical protein IJ615_08795 [Bacteroidaceae bacterium]|nr:hypothetical protein [Bacteroidaceae bacterium]
MKKVLTFVFALVAAISVNAEEYFLVGDGTKIGWTDNSTDRQATRMYEKESGVFEYIGLLKHATEGFNIVDTNNGWNGFSCSTENYAIGDAGTDNYKIRQEWDKKWNPEDENWRWYTITLNTNNGTLSWARDTFTPLTAVDGVYYIGTAEELYKLAIMVRSISEESYKVKLTADIDYTAYSNGINCAIGNVEKCAFNGEFDGQGHTITVDLSATWSRFSLFGTVVGSVHDIKVAGKITGVSNNQIGGICGLLKGNDNKIYNCISAVEIVDAQSGDGTIGGICAVTYDATVIENCAFYGKISAPGRDGCGGIVGWANSGASTTIKNCLIVADINWKDGADFGRNNPSVINSFKVDASDADLANGQMTYKLNVYVSGAENWFQTLGTDAMPTPFSSSEKVYANGTFYCDGVTSKGGDIVLSNTDAAVVDPHAFGADGVCTTCKAAGEEATETDGVFQLNNAGNLLWWAQYVNAGHPASNAVLAADLDMSAAKYTPAGTSEYKYVGTFDGQNHSVTLKLENSGLNYQGLFGVATDGATIKNVVVKGIVKGNSYVAGIVGGSNGSEDGKKLSLINCGNEAEISAANANGAGLIGVNMGGAAHFYVKNCYNVGNVTSDRESGAITGWSGGDKSVFTNVYNIGTVTNGEGDGFMRGGGTLVNTYNLSASDEKVTGGELAYNLGEAFYQELGTDAYPVLDSSKPSVYQLAVGATGYATFVPTVNVAELPAGVEAYAAQVNKNAEGQVYLAPVDEVPADNAVVVKAKEGSYYYNDAATAAAIEENNLTFSAEAIETDGTQYILANGENGVGFYKATGTIAARKGYFTSASGVKAFYFDGDEATGINEELRMENEESSIYKQGSTIVNLAGQRVSKMQKGINIVNGKKVLF